MSKRKIIKIDENKCNGCGLCIPNCPEGALRIIDGKARLISDLFCDGLGACLGHCPQGAITTEEREAGPYDEKKVMENIARQGENVILAHLEHLKEHGEESYLKQAQEYLREKGLLKKPCACPGSREIDWGAGKKEEARALSSTPAQLRNWPVQLMLLPENAPYFKGADLLIAADCVPFSFPDFHSQLLKGKVLLIGCPKLDDAQYYQEKLSSILRNNDIKSVTCAHMEVPCCFGLVRLLKEAISASGKALPFKEITVGIKGEILNEQ